MRFDGRLIMVPWLGVDASGKETKNWSRMRFYGTMNHRRLKREVQRAVNELIGRRVHQTEVRNILRAGLPLHAPSNA